MENKLNNFKKDVEELYDKGYYRGRKEGKLEERARIIGEIEKMPPYPVADNSARLAYEFALETIKTIINQLKD